MCSPASRSRPGRCEQRDCSPHRGWSDTMREDRQRARLLRAIQLTQNVEIDCTTCLDRVPVYVDRALSGADTARDMPDVYLHLALCQDCHEEYEALRDVAELDASGGLPDKASLLRQLQRERREPLPQ